MSKKTSFNYDLLPDVEARRAAKDSAKAIHGLLEKTGQAVVEIGRRLIAVHAALGPATFDAWLRCEFEWNQPLASQYMRAAKAFGDVECLDKFQPTALCMLARGSVTQPVIDEALTIARSGETVTAKKVKGLFETHLVQPVRNDAGKPRTRAGKDSVAQADPGGLSAFQKTLESFATNLDQIARTLPQDARRELAERFLDLAMKLRAVPSEPTTPAKKRKRATTAA